MRRIFMVVVALLAAHFLLPASAHALEVSLASLQRGEVHVVGRGAASNTPIRWQGVQVTTATGGGTFNFKTEDVPATCVGELTDGVETLFIAVNGCTASEIISPEITAAVPVTGQTTSFAAGDDGDIQAGVPFPDPRFTDNMDGTITDNLTGLIWLQNVDCFGTRTWAQALNDANTLADDACGLTDGSLAGDWRLPNVRELHSLVHYGFSLPAISNAAGDAKWTTNGDAFNNFQISSFYWSSTTFAADPDFAWNLGFTNGGVNALFKMSTHFVLPVRGGS